MGALPQRFRRLRLLIVGCGDVGLRVVRQLPRGVRVLALTSSPQRVAALRALGVVPLLGNLDEPHSLRRLAGLAPRVLHLAPPPSPTTAAANLAENFAVDRAAHSSRNSNVYAAASDELKVSSKVMFNVISTTSTTTANAAKQVRANKQVASDPRTRALLQALQFGPTRRLACAAARPAATRAGKQKRHFVYGSTSGVYGDCHGEVAIETRALCPDSIRSRKRFDAEKTVRAVGRLGAWRASILRIPGIYAPDREGGTPRQRLLKGTPVLQAQDDVSTNHIHADDLARACIAALWRGQAQRAYNINDDTQLKMGDYFDLAADLYGLPRPPRVARAQAKHELSAMTISFMGESRRMDNTRMKSELRLRLAYPTVAQGLVSEMVPGAGIEPARVLPRGILSPVRLPISPPGL